MIDNLYKCSLVHFNVIRLADLMDTGVDGDNLWEMSRNEFKRVQALAEEALERARARQYENDNY